MAPAEPASEFALYVGPAGVVLGEGYAGLASDVLGPSGELVPHESVVAISRGEADTSAYWDPCDEHGKPLKAAAGKPKHAADTSGAVS